MFLKYLSSDKRIYFEQFIKYPSGANVTDYGIDFEDEYYIDTLLILAREVNCPSIRSVMSQMIPLWPPTYHTHVGQ